MSTENTKNIMTLFENEITEKGIQDLQDKYPEKLIVDMTDEDQFKSARKTRTEMNKLIEAINRRRIDVTAELKTEGDALISRIEDIYSVIVLPFEKEDKRLKALAKQEKEKLEALLSSERLKISEWAGLVLRSQGKDSEYIAEMIESIDLIETDIFHKDIIHEAIQAKKEAMATLTQLLIDTKARESLDKERAKMEIQGRINTLQMIPSSMFNKSSEDVKKKIASISKYEVTEDDFFDRVQEVEALKLTVVEQLNNILQQAIFNEEQAAIKAEQDAIKEAEANKLLNLHQEAIFENECFDKVAKISAMRKVAAAAAQVEDVAQTEKQEFGIKPIPTLEGNTLSGYKVNESLDSETENPIEYQLSDQILDAKNLLKQVMQGYERANNVLVSQGYETNYDQDLIAVNFFLSK